MRPKYLLITIFLLLISCRKEKFAEPDFNEITNQPLAPQEIENRVKSQLKKGSLFYWEKEDVHVVWSAGMNSDSIFAIGYQPREFTNIEEKIHKIDIYQKEWLETKTELTEIILNFERKSRNKPELSIEDITPMGENEIFPVLFLKITSPELLKILREMIEVRYIEPLGYSILADNHMYKSDSGCSGAPNYNIDYDDFEAVAPWAKVPWNFYDHQIDLAWNQSKGSGIGICIIDTGSSDNQPNLRSNFSSGYSTGRIITALSTKYSGSWWWRTLDPPHDPCGHGTSMAGLAAAPRTNNGNALGVAYGANLMTIRAVEDVLINNSNEREGVRDALYIAAMNPGIKIISMSIGSISYSSVVADGVYYAYNIGKLIIAAAGTSFDWANWWGVIFPANMTQTVAVTGVKNTHQLLRCEVCHSGPEVDFVINMERSTNLHNSIALATYNSQPKYIGGSSTATAITAGIAALAWSANPTASRNEILNTLKHASELFPHRNTHFGWGRINAHVAIGAPPL